MNVLIVDDNALNRKLLRVLLEADEQTPIEADDGVKALAVLAHQPVDVIVSDILMPNMDGFTLCHEVRQRSDWRDIPFILYTSTDFTPEDENLGFDLGADRFVKKQGANAGILEAINPKTAVKKAAK